VRYGPEAEHVVDLWEGDGPLVVFLHGGFWRAAWDRTHVAPLAADLADRGYRVACPEYRRTGSPGGGWPGTFEDVLAAVSALSWAGTWAGPAGQRLSAPPVLAGHSAGGHLAIWAATRVPAAGVLALAPVTDLTEAYRLDLDRGAVAALFDGPPDGYAEADPARLDPPPVPVRIIHGSADAQVPVGMSRVYAARPAGDVRLVELAGVDHFALIDPLDAAWTTVVDTLCTLSAQR
jgi:acetyl esterase/lipase